RARRGLAAHLAGRWTLAEVAAQVGVSPVYLPPAFRDVEGVPLYRYQLRLRLARAPDLLGESDDLTELGLHLGFSSHSHFSAAFQKAYGRTPSQFRRAALRRQTFPGAPAPGDSLNFSTARAPVPALQCACPIPGMTGARR